MSDPKASTEQKAADVDVAIAEGRAVVADRRVCATCAGIGWIEGDGGLLGVVLCPGCGGMRASTP